MTKTNGRVLKDIYKDYFRIGMACEMINGQFTNHEIGNPEKEELMAEQFNSMTCANELKPMYNMGCTDPSAKEDYLPFVINDRAKAMLDWAKANGMQVRGHVMVWHSQCPREVFCKGYNVITIPTDPELLAKNPRLKFFEKIDPVCFVDRDTLLKRLETYIYSLTEYMYANDYMRTIYAWDVVNEAIELDDKTPTGLRDSYWYQIIGDDFIYWAFKYANGAVEKYSHEYASKYGVDASDSKELATITPILFYNDYNEFFLDKKASIIAMLKREGHGHGSILGEKLITGIGMQGHISDNNDIEQYREALEEYSALVPNVHITELDVKCTAAGVNREYYQALFYKEFFEMLIEERKKGMNLTAVVLWGLTDDNSWIRGADPLLFRGDLSPKKAFDALCYAVNGGDLGEPVEEPDTAAEGVHESFEGKEHIAAIRAAGHLPFLMVTDRESHDGKSHSLMVSRYAKDANVKLNISPFVGKKACFTAYVKTSDKMIYVGLDGSPSVEYAAVESNGDWTEVKFVHEIPNSRRGAEIYIETDGTAEIFIDDIDVTLAE